MSVYKSGDRETYRYDFQFRGHRYFGNTGKTSKREAEREEQKIKEKLKTVAGQTASAMNVQTAFAKYFMEVGQYHTNADNTARELEWMQGHLGKLTPLHDITTRTVNDLIAKRRGEAIKHNAKPKPGTKIELRYPGPATVNRTVTVRLRAVMNHAKNIWKISVGDVDRKRLMLKETQERTRELWTDEQERLFAGLRTDYHPIVTIALLTGCRREELVQLTWRSVDFSSGSITVIGKGEKGRLIPMTEKIRAELHALRLSLAAVPAADEPVFTHIVERTRKELGLIRGTREPITAQGLKSIYKRAIEASGIKDFKFHDLRDTRATRLLRDSGNLRLVQNLLGHSDIATTLKYAHVTNDDLKRAMESADRGQDRERVSTPTGEVKT